MKFTAAINFTTLTELLKFYGDADEIVFKNQCKLDEQEIAELCRNARRSVHRLRLHHGAKSAAELARTFGIPVLTGEWRAAEGKIVYLAECSLRPPKISLNRNAIRSISELMPNWADEKQLAWFTESRITEVAIAHELYHLIEPQSTSPAAELKAHAFTREFAALPFSPLLYNELLTRLAKGEEFDRQPYGEG